MNDTALYRKLLEWFYRGQRDFEAKFAEALKQEDPQVPARIAHTLKGYACSIGATALQHAAERLERLLDQSAPATELAPVQNNS